jgi:hypothetical protein
MVTMSHKQACRDLGLKPSHPAWLEEKCRQDTLSTKGVQERQAVAHPVQFPEMEDRLPICLNIREKATWQGAGGELDTPACATRV